MPLSLGESFVDLAIALDQDVSTLKTARGIPTALIDNGSTPRPRDEHEAQIAVETKNKVALAERGKESWPNHLQKVKESIQDIQDHQFGGDIRKEHLVLLILASTGEMAAATVETERELNPCLSQNRGATSDSHEASRPPKVRMLKSTDKGSQEDFFAAAVEQAQHRQRDGKQFRNLKAQGTLQPRYFAGYNHRERAEVKKKGRQVASLWERQGPRSKDWQSVLNILEQNTPAGRYHHLKQMETVRLPEGVLAEFIGNPGESILEIMQRTGSHLQLLGASSGADPSRAMATPSSRFGELTLFGTPGQNAAAIALLPSVVEVAVEDDLNASKSLEDYPLRSEKSSENIAKSGHTDEPADSIWIDKHSEASLDEELQSAVNSVTARAVWDRKEEPGAEHLSNASGVQSPALVLTERVRVLTAPQPRLKERKAHGAQDPEAVAGRVERICSELHSMLYRNKNVTSEALTLAVDFFAQQNALPQMREVLYNAAVRSQHAIGAPVFDRVLASCAQAQSVVDFKHILTLMLRQRFRPTTETWTHFHTMISLRFPPHAETVVDKMREKELLANPSVVIAIIQNSIERQLSQHLDDSNSLGAFISKVDARWPGINWLTRSAGNRMLKHLLSRGQRDNAFLVFDLMVSRGILPKSDTLNTFLASPHRDRDLKDMIAVLERFDKCSKLVVFNQVTYNMLFTIAWRKRYWNVLRVVWRYAVCAGFLDFSIQDRIQRSLVAALPDLAKGESESEASTRQQVWQPLAGKFAVGVIDGLKSHLPESPQTSSQEGQQEHRGSPSSLTDREISLLDTASTISSPTRLRALRSHLRNDMNEVESLRPRYPILEKLKEAYLKDVRWKERALGLPSGLQRGGRYQKLGTASAILEELFKHGVSVPVTVGDGTKGQRVGGRWVQFGNSVGDREGGEEFVRELRGGDGWWQAEEWGALDAEKAVEIGRVEEGDGVQGKD